MTQEWQSKGLLDTTFKEHAPAKINLRLKVLGRREDGYHLMSMLNITAPPIDRVSITMRTDSAVDIQIGELQDTNLKQHCWLGEPIPSDASNLALRAFSSFCESFGIPFGAEIKLEKGIPVGTGLGGGSSDAAAVLRVLARVLGPGLMARDGIGLEVFRSQLNVLALELGADVPYLLHPGLAHVQGVGERVTPLHSNSLRGEPFLLIVPKARKSTANVFAKYREVSSHNSYSEIDFAFEDIVNGRQGGSTMLSINREELISLVSNDLEGVVSDQYPIVKEILERIRAVPGIRASISGSGTAVFCITEDSDKPNLLTLAKKSLANLAVDSFESEFL